MKTTNYEISKKLAEIGFNGESETWKHDPENFITGQKYWSYDLETLLEALPAKIETERGVFLLQMSIIPLNKDNRWLIGYSNETDIEQKENESLADTAARLLIQLFEAGIINFNK